MGLDAREEFPRKVTYSVLRTLYLYLRVIVPALKEEGLCSS